MLKKATIWCWKRQQSDVNVTDPSGNTGSSSNVNINIVEWLVFMPAVRLFVGSALTISSGLACKGSPLIGVLLMYFFQKFRFRVCV